VTNIENYYHNSQLTFTTPRYCNRTTSLVARTEVVTFLTLPRFKTTPKPFSSHSQAS